MPQSQLQEMTLEALKALAYDQMLELNRVQTNLSIINSEISKKLQVANITVPVEEKPIPAEENN